MRVGLQILNEGSYTDEGMVIEYLGGVLASCRSTSQRQATEGSSYVAMISRLADVHLRLHYVLYRALQLKLHGQRVNFYDCDVVASQLNLFLPTKLLAEVNLVKSAEIDPEDLYNPFDWLIKEGLITLIWGGARDDYKALVTHVMPDTVEMDVGGGIIVRPTPLGVAFYTWAFGKSGSLDGYLTAELQEFAVRELLVPDVATLFSR